jgi:GNAT superfamily N-acetyltransferase
MDVSGAAHVASRGFFDDPVMSWVFPDLPTRAEALEASFASLARRFLTRSGRIDLVEAKCTAMWLPPDPPEPSEDIVAPRESWHLFTPDVAERFTALGTAMDAAHPETHHWYLGVVATLPEEQGHGLGTRLLRPVLDVCDREGVPAYLESSNARNLPFYFRMGWIQTGEIVVPDGPTLFPMWREPRDPV